MRQSRRSLSDLTLAVAATEDVQEPASPLSAPPNLDCFGIVGFA